MYHAWPVDTPNNYLLHFMDDVFNLHHKFTRTAGQFQNFCTPIPNFSHLLEQPGLHVLGDSLAQGGWGYPQSSSNLSLSGLTSSALDGGQDLECSPFHSNRMKSRLHELRLGFIERGNPWPKQFHDDEFTERFVAQKNLGGTWKVSSPYRSWIILICPEW